jgi:hypothetical protein
MLYRHLLQFGQRKQEMEIRTYVYQVFPAVRGEGALSEDQTLAAQKRRKIRERLRLPAMSKRIKTN